MSQLKSDEPGREMDWGVPLPGDFVAHEKRVDTHLKRLPLGKLDAKSLFGRTAPLVVDLGCGNGRATILSALVRPHVDHFAIDIFPGAIRHAVKRANRRGLGNIRFVVADAGDVVRRLLPEKSVDEIHLYHPQPIYDLAEAHKRLVTPIFLHQLSRALKEDGLFIIQTDHPAYWEYLQKVIPLFFTMKEESGPWPDAPLGRTRREVLARQQGLPVFRAICHPHVNLDHALAQKLAEELPLPRFDADRRLKMLDDQERDEPVGERS